MTNWLPTLDAVKKFKDAMDSPKGALGPFMISRDPALYEAAGLAGYDFVLVDMEHGVTAFSNLVDVIRGCNSVGVCPVVRVPRGTDIWISRALDVGAGALMIPQIDSAEQTAAAIDAAKFSPMGHRGLSKYVRAGAYNALTEDKIFYERGNETAIVIQAEGKKAFENIDEIMSVPGVDVVFIGPYDLSSSLGLIGQVEHPEVVSMIKQIVAHGAQHGVKVGCFADTVERGIQLREMGVKFIGYGTDVNMFYKFCKNDVDKFAL